MPPTAPCSKIGPHAVLHTQSSMQGHAIQPLRFPMGFSLMTIEKALIAALKKRNNHSHETQINSNVQKILEFSSLLVSNQHLRDHKETWENHTWEQRPEASL
ncbi:hypothetical protein Y1Q_0010681 [Alligator mississippiensis]|uniref:Uncharacterized protein n=1 Tax=Alligator mississippiensis TaxID=8496 RepID=A0A151M6N2_ALLMI|nr:hypothetical protein Y1Q_0010681 [Alligator mississippiensis]